MSKSLRALSISLLYSFPPSFASWIRLTHFPGITRVGFISTSPKGARKSLDFVKDCYREHTWIQWRDHLQNATSIVRNVSLYPNVLSIIVYCNIMLLPAAAAHWQHIYIHVHWYSLSLFWGQAVSVLESELSLRRTVAILLYSCTKPALMTEKAFSTLPARKMISIWYTWSYWTKYSESVLTRLTML